VGLWFQRRNTKRLAVAAGVLGKRLPPRVAGSIRRADEVEGGWKPTGGDREF